MLSSNEACRYMVEVMIELAVVETTVQHSSQSDNVFNIIGPFDVPRYIYSTERKKFVPLTMTTHSAPCLCGSARDKAEFFRERYTLLQQVSHRHELFTPPVIEAGPLQKKLKTVEALLGSTSKLREIIVLGMVTHLKLALTRIERGGPSAQLSKRTSPLNEVWFVMVSDVWLDSVEVLEKIHLMFSGYADMPPTCFIFCRNFSPAPYGNTNHSKVKNDFKYSTLYKCLCPQATLADHITEEFRQRVPFCVHYELIQYCSQEIMCRNCVRLPTSNRRIPNHFVKTILLQGHLATLPLCVSPVFWAYDYALRVYPMPVIIFADKYDPFNISNTDCLYINLGCFPKSGFTFKDR
uniref:DNA polymerase II subunit 2 n=1 Tax=Oncorhynchus tshawytscha TaxID=74940 RepID=A0A8C8EMB8_ONCTS